MGETGVLMCRGWGEPQVGGGEEVGETGVLMCRGWGKPQVGGGGRRWERLEY